MMGENRLSFQDTSLGRGQRSTYAARPLNPTNQVDYHAACGRSQRVLQLASR